MFGYKLVKEQDLKKAITSITNCGDNFQTIGEKIEILDLSEEVKRQLWIEEVYGMASVINAQMNLCGLGNFNFEGFLEDWKKTKKDEA